MGLLAGFGCIELESGYVPDVLAVFFDCPVGGELAHARGVVDGHLRPVIVVGKAAPTGPGSRRRTDSRRREDRDRCSGGRRPGAEEVAIAAREAAGADAVDDFAEGGVGLVDAVGVVAGGFGGLDLGGGEAEEEEVVGPTASRISMLAPSSVPMVSAPFMANFMLPVPEASLPAVEICSQRSAAG